MIKFKPSLSALAGQNCTFLIALGSSIKLIGVDLLLKFLKSQIASLFLFKNIYLNTSSKSKFIEW